jgi:hypothetical protein
MRKQKPSCSATRRTAPLPPETAKESKNENKMEITTRSCNLASFA